MACMAWAVISLAATRFFNRGCQAPRRSKSPPLRSNLGYLGAETYFFLYGVAAGLPPFDVYYRTGGNMFNEQQGGGLEVREIPVGKSVELRGQVDGWYDGLAKKLGGNIEQSATWRASRYVGVTEALGVKSLGGLLGKPTEAGAYGYVGLRLYRPEATR